MWVLKTIILGIKCFDDPSDYMKRNILPWSNIEYKHPCLQCQLSSDFGRLFLSHHCS